MVWCIGQNRWSDLKSKVKYYVNTVYTQDIECTLYITFLSNIYRVYCI